MGARIKEDIQFMEMKIDSYIKEQFGIENVDIRTYSPLALAYIGDGIFDLVIRSLIVGKEIQRQASSIIRPAIL